MTAQGVKRYCDEAFKAGYIYLWGADGEIITEDLLKRLKARYGTSNYTKIDLAKVEGKTGADCSGFLTRLSGKDTTAAGYYSDCPKRGIISEMPKDKVCLIFRKENNKIVHVGVYTGDGRLTEMYNDCQQRTFIASQWTYYGLPDWIEQNAAPIVAGQLIEVPKDTGGYSTAADAINGTNRKTTVLAGTYYVYKVYGKAINVSRVKTSAGSWICL